MDEDENKAKTHENVWVATRLQVFLVNGKVVRLSTGDVITSMHFMEFHWGKSIGTRGYGREREREREMFGVCEKDQIYDPHHITSHPWYGVVWYGMV